MGLNVGHLKSLVGVLKIAGLIIGIIAGGLGAHGFINSEYNKSCRDSPVGIATTPSVTTGSDLTGSDGTGITTLRTRPPPSQKIQSETTEEPTTWETTVTSDEPIKDMAPVLWMERFHIGATFSAVVISAVLLVLYIVKSDLEYNKFFKTINFGFHFVGCVLLILSAIFMAFATIEIDDKICQYHFDNKQDCQAYREKMSAAAFAFLLAVVYAVISVKTLSTKLYEEV